MITRRIQHYTGSFIAIVVVALILLIGYFNFIDGRLVRIPITFTSDPMAIATDKAVYHRGDVVKGRLEFCKNRNIKANLQWTLVDHTLTFFPPVISTLQKGCFTRDITIQTIPLKTTPEDAMYFEGLVQYQVNPFSVITVPLKTQVFKVI